MRRLKRVALVVAALAALLAAALGLLSWHMQTPVPGELERLHIDGERRALIVYHPSMIDNFQQELTMRFGEGLVREGWQIHRITADPKRLAALDLESYDTIVFGTNTYNWRIDQPTEAVLAALPDLQQRFCAGLLSGFGSTDEAEEQLRTLLKAKGCHEPLVWNFWLLRPHDDPGLDPNDPRDNRAIALELAAARGQRSGIYWKRYRVRD